MRTAWARDESRLHDAGLRPVLVALIGFILFVLGRWSVSGACPAAVGLGPQEVAREALDSLYDPPSGHGRVDVPSVLKDARGEIHNLEIGGARFNVLVSKAGSMRSGDVHRWPQLDAIFSGCVQVTTREDGKDIVRTYGGGDHILIPAHIPHMFRFVNDTVMAEFWLGPFDARYYRPYRAQVDASTEMLLMAAGRQSGRKELGRQGRARAKLTGLGKLRDTLSPRRRANVAPIPPRNIR